MNRIVKLKDNNGQVVYPIAHSDAVKMAGEEKTLTRKIAEIDGNIGEVRAEETDLSSLLVWHDGCLNTAEQTLLAPDPYQRRNYFDFIDISAFDTLGIDLMTDTADSVMGLLWYDENYTPVDTGIKTKNTGIKGKEYKRIPIPAAAKYVRSTMWVTHVDGFVIKAYIGTSLADDLKDVKENITINRGRIDTIATSTKSNGYVNNNDIWTLSSTIYGYWFDVSDFQGRSLMLKANSTRSAVIFFSSEIITEVDTVTYLGKGKITKELGTSEIIQIPVNENGKVYVWVFAQSDSQNATPEVFDLYDSVSNEFSRLNNSLSKLENSSAVNYQKYLNADVVFTEKKVIKAKYNASNYGQQIMSTAGFCASNYIDVSSYTGKTIRIRMLTFAGEPSVGLCFYTAQDESTVIAGVVCNNTGVLGVEDRLVTIPENAVYMRTTYAAESSPIYIPFIMATVGDDGMFSRFVYQLRGNDGNMQLRRELFDYARRYKSYYSLDDTVWGIADMLLTKDDFSQHGRLKMLNNRLVDQNDNPITLRGLNTGPNICETYRFNLDALRCLKYYGVNYLRLNVYIHWNPDPTKTYLYSEENRVKMDAAIEEIVENCTALGIYVLIGWHSHNVHNPQSADTDLEAQKTFFRKFSQMFGSYGNVMFELHNEPWRDTAASLITGMKECYNIIRGNAPYAVIMTGHGREGSGKDDSQEMINQLAANGMSDVFVSQHPYLPQSGLTTKAAVDTYINKVLGKPIVFTEFGGRGATSESNDSITEYFMRKCEENHILNGFWSYADNAWNLPDTDIWDSQQNYHTLIESRDYLSHGGYTDGLLTKDGQTYFLVYRDLAFGV